MQKFRKTYWSEAHFSLGGRVNIARDHFSTLAQFAKGKSAAVNCRTDVKTRVRDVAPATLPLKLRVFLPVCAIIYARWRVKFRARLPTRKRIDFLILSIHSRVREMSFGGLSVSLALTARDLRKSDWYRVFSPAGNIYFPCHLNKRLEGGIYFSLLSLVIYRIPFSRGKGIFSIS